MSSRSTGKISVYLWEGVCGGNINIWLTDVKKTKLFGLPLGGVVGSYRRGQLTQKAAIGAIICHSYVNNSCSWGDSEGLGFAFLGCVFILTPLASHDSAEKNFTEVIGRK